ncbi:tRNA (adenosine(37)-N6)-dimethylallyltransferase MiaA [bacterium]|jgi:tRNA dimethylallyltransferase|nr:tRNA (adenosine(37)-N6)-dimethylallyltransferase MiaA [bacterium]
MKEIAIIGSTASGKTALSLQIASITNSIILSLDSLCVYKDIEIASAKPTVQERGDIVHFGIDEVFPNINFDVIKFIELYKKAKEYALKNDKNLIIVGGTGFYLKALIEGLSQGVESKIELDIPQNEAYELLYNIDKEYMQRIEKNDRYRIEKAYAIYKQTGLSPSSYFEQNPKIPVAKNLKIFEILWEKDELKNRISQRTKIMIDSGLIDEVIFLERKYTREPNCMASIGIVETLEYLDGKLTKRELEEKISANTIKLAKRQNTFNKSQFPEKTSNIIENLNSDILKYFLL